MRTLPLSVQTLYADLLQQADLASDDEATVVATVSKGIRYLRLQRWVGGTRTVEHLGRADDPEIVERAGRVEAEMRRRMERRRIVDALKRFVPGPSAALGRLLDALAFAGLFARGGVLVGTAAYGCYPLLLGRTLDASASTTQDADLATVDLTMNSRRSNEDLLTVIRRADPTFAPIPGLDRLAPPSRFRTKDGYMLDLLTPQRRRSDRDPMPLAGLGAGATPLQHLDWLVASPIRVVALHGAGVPIVVPAPARFAVHKLVLAQKRPGSEAAKRRKDLVQAASLLRALRETAPWDLDDVLADARSKGRRGWAEPIDRSLREIDLAS